MIIQLRGTQNKICFWSNAWMNGHVMAATLANLKEISNAKQIDLHLVLFSKHSN